MKKINLTLILVFAVLFVGTSFAQDAEFVGVKTCGMCHKAKTGDQLGIWEKSAHANAFKTLQGDKAKEIAKTKGIENPAEAAECLSCHVTGANVEGAKFSKKFKQEDGVGCESCHGAGSEYKSKKTMMDTDKSVAAGMTDYRVEGAMLKNCTTCHNEKSPTYKGFDLEKRWAEIAHPTKK